MGTSRGLTFESFQRWRRSFEIAFWPAFFVLNTVFNGVISVMDHPNVPAWQPWVWESSSAIVMLALVPALVTASRRWPIRIDTWQRNLPLHLVFSVVFSVIHVTGMVTLRKLAYAIAGHHYDFRAWATNIGYEYFYEYLKDGRSYVWLLVAIGLYRFWVMRLQGEARLLE